MNRTLISLVCLAALPLAAAAQRQAAYTGGSAAWGSHALSVSPVARLERVYKSSWQGMDAWGRWIVSLQDHGVASFFAYDGRRATLKGRTKLGSYQVGNHANVCFFGTRKLSPQDELPLLYVSHCAGRTELYAEHLDPRTFTARRVQTIRLDDPAHRHGSTAQWVYDRSGNYLCAFGSTTGSKGIGNRHWVLKFPMPEYNGPQDSIVTLTPRDAIEDYHMEDYYGVPFSPLIQGGCIHDGLLYMPTGAGRYDLPSVLYVWDMNAHRMRNIIDLQGVLPTETEDCSVLDGALIMQCHDEIFKITFP